MQFKEGSASPSRRSRATVGQESLTCPMPASGPLYTQSLPGSSLAFVEVQGWICRHSSWGLWSIPLSVVGGLQSTFSWPPHPASKW